MTAAGLSRHTKLAFTVSQPTSEPAPCSPPGLAPGEQDRWFKEWVQPHEAPLRSYLKGTFPAVRDVDDLIQESYLRMFQTRASRPIESAKAFLYFVARRLALDTLRRNKTASHEAVVDFNPNGVIEEGPSVPDAISQRQEVRLLAEAIHSLPARCREVMILRKIEGLSQKQIAERCNIAEATVEAQVRRGMAKCEQHFSERGMVVSRRRHLP